MKYRNVLEAVQAYKDGKNVSEFLRQTLKEDRNSEDIIEVAYDLQAGSYVKYHNENLASRNAYIEELSLILSKFINCPTSTLEVGTGECTTLTGVSERCFSSSMKNLACDISWSRLSVGREFARQNMSAANYSKLELFVANLFSIPLPNKSIDVVWTSHALEPNGGREVEALKEIFRVARNTVCLFEPCYERNTPEGKKRMERHGYIRDLPGAIKTAGGELIDCIQVTNSSPLNPTYAFVVSLSSQLSTNDEPSLVDFACPITHLELAQAGNFMWCEQSYLAYPILEGIPILRPEASILASALKPKISKT